MQFGHLAFGQSAMKTMIDQIFRASRLRSIRTDLLSVKVNRKPFSQSPIWTIWYPRIITVHLNKYNTSTKNFNQKIT